MALDGVALVISALGHHLLGPIFPPADDVADVVGVAPGTASCSCAYRTRVFRTIGAGRRKMLHQHQAATRRCASNAQER